MTEPGGEAGLPITYVPNWAERSRRMLLGMDWSKPRIVALAESLGVGSQELEDVNFDLLMSIPLPNALGHTLDLYGRIVGEQRGGLADVDYRRFIEARILANISGSTVDEVIRIFQLVTSPSDVQYLPMHPAGFTLQAIRKEWLSARMRRRVRRIMNDVRPAGVTMELLEGLNGYFGFEGAPRAAGYGDGVLSRVL